MSTRCPDKQYFDEVVDRCQGCHDICYGSFLHDFTSDCSRFCPDMMKMKPPPGSASSTDIVTIIEIVLIASAAVILASVIGVLIWRRFGSRRHTLRQSESQDMTSRQITAEHPENTPVQAEEMAMSELYIGPFPSDHLLTNSDV